MKAATGREAAEKIIRDISIHAAREGGDPVIIALYNDVLISIHAAREGGDDSDSSGAPKVFAFQSTPPVKAATCGYQ